MATINFYLDRPDSKGMSPIVLVYQSMGRKFKFPVKEKIDPKYCDKKKQRAKSIASASEINDLLGHYKDKLKKIERELRITDDNYSFEKLKNAFLEKGEEKKGLFPFLEGLLSDLASTHHNRTIMKYRTLVNDLKEFEKQNKTSLTFEKIDFEFQPRFVDFLTQKKLNSQNTVAKKISTLKTLLGMATKAKVNDNLDYKDFEVRRVETEKVYLTNEELFRLYNLDLSDNKRLEKTRDIFCFGCFTGLRYSDIETLKFENIISKSNRKGQTNKSIKIQVHKTKASLIVPLNKYAIGFIDKYEKIFVSTFNVVNADSKMHAADTTIFPTFSIQRMNDYIKEIAKLAGIITPVSITKYIGQQRIDETFYKYQLLATHSARRTFAILSLEKGMRIEVLQKILGHKSIRTTMKYVFIQEDVKENEMEKAWG